MAESDEGGEKSFDASPERLRKARAEGNVPNSPDVQTALRYAGLLGVMAFAAGGLATTAAQSLAGFLNQPFEASSYLFTGGGILPLVAPTASALVTALLVPLGLILAALIVQQAIVFAPKKLKPDLKRISPLRNAGQKFGGAGLIEFSKSLVKLAVFCAAGAGFGLALLPRLLSRTGAAAGVLPIELGVILTGMLGIAFGLSAVAGAIDLPLKRAQHAKKLRMTRQEMLDEAKESEGDPEQKRARKRKAQEIASMAQMKDVPSADVVIVNPEHYAVALKWDRSGGDVPRCVAKGVDHLALAIKQRAREAGVPIHRDIACARALHATVDVGEPIRREHFTAVAAAIRFADRIRQAKG